MSYESKIPETIDDLSKAKNDTLAAIGYLISNGADDLAAVDTGRLRQSIQHILELHNDSVYVGSTVDHSIYVEFGTKYMEAQPFLMPAAFNNIEQIRKIAEGYYNGINNST